MPRELEKETLHKGGVAYCSNDVTATTWKDKRYISLLTTHSLDSVETRKMGRNNGVKIPQLTVVVDYKKNRSGTDLRDQILNKFHIMLWFNKAHNKIFLHILYVILLDAYNVQKTVNGNYAEHFKYSSRS
jgi:hypothetical protein